LDKSSKTYKEACQLLNKKFEELKNLLTSLDEEKQYMQYLKSDPDDHEILELFDDCWHKTFNLQPLSYSFLKSSKERLAQPPSTPFSIEHLERDTIEEEFVINVSSQQFTDEMMHFYENIKNDLPCGFNEVFKGSKNQIEVYKRFIYVLHLIQSKKIKFQPETNTLYE
jgi:chromatin segregation and condensation protein Rec8/ScpA/Scc1 (kleisin family)